MTLEKEDNIDNSLRFLYFCFELSLFVYVVTPLSWSSLLCQYRSTFVLISLCWNFSCSKLYFSNSQGFLEYFQKSTSFFPGAEPGPGYHMIWVRPSPSPNPGAGARTGPGCHMVLVPVLVPVPNQIWSENTTTEIIWNLFYKFQTKIEQFDTLKDIFVLKCLFNWYG